MAADKGFEAWSLLTPEEEERRSAGAGVTFLAAGAGVTGLTGAVAAAAPAFAAGLAIGFTRAGCGADATGAAALVLPAAGLAADFFSAAAVLLLPGAVTAF